MIVMKTKWDSVFITLVTKLIYNWLLLFESKWVFLEGQLNQSLMLGRWAYCTRLQIRLPEFSATITRFIPHLLIRSLYSHKSHKCCKPATTHITNFGTKSKATCKSMSCWSTWITKLSRRRMRRLKTIVRNIKYSSTLRNVLCSVHEQHAHSYVLTIPSTIKKKTNGLNWICIDHASKRAVSKNRIYFWNCR